MALAIATQDGQLMAGTSAKVINFAGSALIQEESRFSDIDVPISAIEPDQRPEDGDGITEAEDSRMEVVWKSAMCNAMDLPMGYKDVAVLIIKWSEEIDQLKSGPEVERLDEIFRTKFHYKTRIANIHNRKCPQLQLGGIIHQFIEEHSGPDNLLIVYYTGHGLFDENKNLLELHASNSTEAMPTGRFDAKMIWNKAEEPLIEYAEGDILTIFDTCFASNLHRSVQREEARTYEMLTASGHYKTTAGPGPKSFTTALISALTELLERNGNKPFSTRQLCEEINLRHERRRNQSHVWSRFKVYDRYISLAPLKRKSDHLLENYYRQPPTRSFLFLRLSLKVERPSDQQIESLAKNFSKVVKDINAPVKRIDWFRLRSSRKMTSLADLTIATKYGRIWKKRYERSRRESLNAQGSSNSSSTSSPSTHRKMIGHDDDGEKIIQQQTEHGLPSQPASSTVGLGLEITSPKRKFGGEHGQLRSRPVPEVFTPPSGPDGELD